MMVFGSRWFKRYQKWLVLFANTLLGRFILGLPVTMARVKSITPESCAMSRDNVHYQAYVYAGKQYANRLYYALKPLWRILHAIDSINARCGWQLNFGFDTLNVYSPASGDSACGFTWRTAVNETFATIIGAAGTAGMNNNLPEAYLRGSTTSAQYQTLSRGIMTFKTGALYTGLSPQPKTASSITVTAIDLKLRGHGKNNGLGAPSLAIVASTPASNTAVATGDHVLLGSTLYATAVAYADFAVDSYNTIALNATAIAALDLSATHFKVGMMLEWDRAGSFGGTWASGADSSFVVDNGADEYPYVVVTYTPPAVQVLSAQSVTSAGVGNVCGNATLTGAAGTKRRLQVSDENVFAIPLADSTLVTEATTLGSAFSIITSWTPASAGTYYARIGVESTNYDIIWGSTITFIVQFPSITSVAVSRQNERHTVTVVVEDDYTDPPEVTVYVDDRAYVAHL
jgi:hypothetical protein